LTTDQVLVFDWIASSSQVNLLISAGLVISFANVFPAVLDIFEIAETQTEDHILINRPHINKQKTLLHILG